MGRMGRCRVPEVHCYDHTGWTIGECYSDILSVRVAPLGSHYQDHRRVLQRYRVPEVHRHHHTGTTIVKCFSDVECPRYTAITTRLRPSSSASTISSARGIPPSPHCHYHRRVLQRYRVPEVNRHHHTVRTIVECFNDIECPRWIVIYRQHHHRMRLSQQRPRNAVLLAAHMHSRFISGLLYLLTLV